jgi:ABC-2 type transport system ATP-binding protein
MTGASAIPTLASMVPILEIERLSKRYGDLVAVDSVDLSVTEGEIFGILGLNGAGKTTLVECAQGLRRPDAGSVRLLGRDPRHERSALAARVGSQLQDSNLPERMRVNEAVKLFAERRVSRDAIAEWGLDELWSKSFGSLSGGQRQRLFIALALVNEPEIVFLDELTQGLDPAARRIVWDLVKQIRDRGTTVVLVTHFTDEAEVLCDRVVMMRDGRLVAHGSPAELVERHGPGVGVSFTDPNAEAVELRSICGVRSVGISGDRVELRGDRRMLAHIGAHLVEMSRARGTPVPTDLHVDEPRLEDAVLDLIGRTAA